MAALGPVDLGELSGLASLDERFLAEAGLLGEQDEAESAGGTWQAALDFAAKSDDGGAGAGALDQAMEFEALPVQLRCIDPAHPADCTRCKPAPPDASAVELMGDCGKKNGEKKLRALLTRVPEWNLLSERRKLVPLAHKAGLDALAVALEEKKTSALRKAHLIFMAKHWGYKSDTWVPRHDRAADRAMAELQRRAAQPLPLTLPRFGDAAVAPWGGVWNESVLAPEAAWLFTQRTLRPLSLQIAGAFAGDQARLAAESQGAEHITLAAAAEVRKVADMAPGLLAQLSGLHAMLTAAQRALPPALAATPAATLLSSPAYAGADALLRMVLDAGAAQLGLAARASSARLSRDGLTASEAAWLQEMARSHEATLELLSHVARVLNAFRAAPMAAFLDVAGSMLETLIVFITSLGTAASARESWMMDMIRQRGGESAAGGGGGGDDRARLLVCWPVAPSELSATSASPSSSDSAGQQQQTAAVH